jgi:hypothetical protein
LKKQTEEEDDSEAAASRPDETTWIGHQELGKNQGLHWQWACLEKLDSKKG